ncbi:hypothetical protein GGX14DRAFT_403690 [Mycena pura]|uniref:DUF6533 domain-containing protein n=1 Tax=Mycena pura TaxID=153505 RepID=A0AAD6Y4C3_9AGAR|nr:hypothetical protein GGX14DRAFT_403690 [Mycena pura]
MATLDDVVFAQDQRLRISVSLAGFYEIPKIHVLTAVFIYDYLLTLSVEVMYIWVRGNELGSAWFLLIRYSAILGNIAEAFLLFGSFSPETCNRLDTVHGLLVVALEFAVAWTLMLRVYAMYSRNKRMLAFWISASLLLVGIAVWSVSSNVNVPNVHITLAICDTAQPRVRRFKGSSQAWTGPHHFGTHSVPGIPTTEGANAVWISLASLDTRWIITLANLANILIQYDSTDILGPTPT